MILKLNKVLDVMNIYGCFVISAMQGMRFILKYKKRIQNTS